MLPHAGVLHLLFNLYWVWVFGSLIEETFGHLKTAGLIILLAVASNAWEFALLSGGVGLSGVGYGFFGFLWILSKHDPRFHDAVDKRTVELFVGWFFFCIIATWAKIMPVANLAHGVGALTGILLAFAIADPQKRALATSALAVVVIVGLWGSTAGRPRINMSRSGGYEEANWGYDALAAKRYPEAVHWFQDAVHYQPKSEILWFDLAIAYDGVGNKVSALEAGRKAAEFGEPAAQVYLGDLYLYGRNGFPRDERQALAWYLRAAKKSDPAALNNAAWMYATNTDPTIHNPAAALEYARKAVDLTKAAPEANYLDTLAAAFAANTQFQEAVDTEKQALALSSPEQKAIFGEALQKYELAVNNDGRLPKHR
jgi:membrane associated rhomboid family serine protease